MRARIFITSAAVAILIAAAPLFAKGPTIRITIHGGDLRAPIEINDRHVAGFFNVWTGAGTSSNEAQGLIVDRGRVVESGPMGSLLEKAISEASKLPESEQEAIGAWLLAEIESERRWDELFKRPATALESLADEALEDHKRGRTTPLDPDRL